MTTFLFSAVAISGVKIISKVEFTRRNRFILTAAMSLGFGATLVPTWFSYVFTYTGDNRAKRGFFDAIVLVMETGFAVTAFLSIILNLILQEEDESEEIESLAGDIADREMELELENGIAGPGQKDVGTKESMSDEITGATAGSSFAESGRKGSNLISDK